MHLWFGKGAWASKLTRQRIEQLEPTQVKSVAVIRHAALGDMLLTRPFLVECRRFFPNARITLSISSNYQRGAPEDLVDRLHIVYGSDQRGVSLFRQFRCYRELGEHDIIFDLAATSRSYWTCLLNRALFKVGFPYRKTQGYLFYNITVPRSDMRYEADNMMDMLNIMGAKSAYPLDFAFQLKTEETKRDYVLFFPSASTPIRCWDHDRVAEVVRRLAVEYPQLDIYVLEGMAEWEKVDHIVAKAGSPVNVHAKQCNDYNETVRLLASARLVVSNDTGIRHLAVALQTPTVCVFFDEQGTKSTPFRYWPRYDIHDVVFRSDARQPEAEEVYSSVKSLLERVSR